MFDKNKERDKAFREGRESLNEFTKKLKKLENLQKNKKSKGGLIKGFPKLAKKGF